MLNKDQRTGMFLSGLENRPVTEKKYRTIYADVQFGQPSMRCRGSGICRVDLYRGSLHNERSKCARAIAMIEWKDGKVHLLFSKYAICRHLAETYFEKGKIRLREPVTLSNALCERLGIAGLELPAGIFKVTKEDPYFIIGFPALSIGIHLPQSARLLPDVLLQQAKHL